MKLTSLIGRLCNKDVKSIGLFGLGKCNKRLAEILISEGWGHGFICRSSNTCEHSEIIDVKNSYFGDSALTNIREDILFLSPSVRRCDSLLRKAECAGCMISSDAELFFHANPKNVLAITGSDGKSTVTYLTSKLTEASLGAIPAGNYGLPLCELIKRDKISGAVVELSSFQLSYIKPKLSRALITNITENHLNWHSDFDEYIRAKKNIFENAELRALVSDGDICERIAKENGADIIISDKASATELNRKFHPWLTVTRECGSICVNGIPYIPERIFLRKESYIILDFMCAIALSHGFSDKEAAIELAKSFGGLPHRKEVFLTHGGVTYINSSIDSTPNRTAITLSTLPSKSIVIVGGAAKGLSYEPLVSALSSYAKAVIFTGDSALELALLFERVNALSGRIYIESDFDAAAELAVRIAKPADTVILSPAHTSYDRFENFEERGEHFKKIIREITK